MKDHVLCTWTLEVNVQFNFLFFFKVWFIFLFKTTAPRISTGRQLLSCGQASPMVVIQLTKPQRGQPPCRWQATVCHRQTSGIKITPNFKILPATHPVLLTPCKARRNFNYTRWPHHRTKGACSSWKRWSYAVRTTRSVGNPHRHQRTTSPQGRVVFQSIPVLLCTPSELPSLLPGPTGHRRGDVIQRVRSHCVPGGGGGRGQAGNHNIQVSVGDEHWRTEPHILTSHPTHSDLFLKIQGLCFISVIIWLLLHEWPRSKYSYRPPSKMKIHTPYHHITRHITWCNTDQLFLPDLRCPVTHSSIQQSWSNYDNM